MSDAQERIFLGTMILERSRFVKDIPCPSTSVSQWTQRICGDGFDGLELWANHALLADEEERERLRTGPMPVTLFNSYASCEPEDVEGRKRTAQMANLFKAEGMKFNFGKHLDHRDAYIEVVREWATMFRPGYRMISENHRGTITADADVAADVYAGLSDLPVQGIIHFNNDRATYEERFGKYGDRLTHIHCMLSNEDGPMPESEVRKRVEWLREFNFSGTYTIEFTQGVRGDHTDLEAIYRNAVRDFQMLRKCLAGN
jgi:sugar phosphate isomerase/epimerase